MPVRFCPLASGSDGNSFYVGTEHTHILIDAGLSGKQIEKNLTSIHRQVSEIDAIFITHEHSDHIKGAGVLSRRYNIPLYATGGTWDAMQDSASLGKIELRNKRYVYPQENCVINDLRILPFEIPHDACEPVAYSVYACDHKISLATDMGHITDTVKENLADSSAILLESNHDVEMLKNGTYPFYLKQRILGKKGHLSNHLAGELLTELVSERLKYVFLGHLSHENNSPTLALNTVKNILKTKKILPGKNFELNMANRSTSSEFVEFV